MLLHFADNILFLNEQNRCLSEILAMEACSWLISVFPYTIFVEFYIFQQAERKLEQNIIFFSFSFRDGKEKGGGADAKSSEPTEGTPASLWPHRRTAPGGSRAADSFQLFRMGRSNPQRSGPIIPITENQKKHHTDSVDRKLQEKKTTSLPRQESRRM